MTTIYRPISDPQEFDTFGCHPFEKNPATPDRIAQQVFLRRQVSDWNVVMKDGSQLQFWGFKDPNISGSDSPWPSMTIRVKQGQIVHCEFRPSKGAHTIHWHGIEPTTMNDGVGHTSFEVDDIYTYQWCAHQAGTYLYHCHKNTVLHFEMGMYGVLIVDPITKSPDTKNPNYLYDPFTPGSTAEAPGITAGAPYGAELILVFDDVDPVWHKLSHNAGMCGDDVGLDKFNPRYFLINGVHNGITQTDKRTVTRTTAGKNVSGPSRQCLIQQAPCHARHRRLDRRSRWAPSENQCCQGRFRQAEASAQGYKARGRGGAALRALDTEDSARRLQHHRKLPSLDHQQEALRWPGHCQDRRDLKANDHA